MKVSSRRAVASIVLKFSAWEKEIKTGWSKLDTKEQYRGDVEGNVVGLTDHLLEDVWIIFGLCAQEVLQQSPFSAELRRCCTECGVVRHIYCFIYRYFDVAKEIVGLAVVLKGCSIDV